MEQTFHVSHYSGCGNDFVIIDDRKEQLKRCPSHAVSAICSTLPNNVDGLILIRPSLSCDLSMRYYNLDGTEAEMCGNGVRCLMQYLKEKGNWPLSECLLETKERYITLFHEGTHVTVGMGNASIVGWDIVLPFQGRDWILHSIHTGVPHLVTFVDDIETIDIQNVGSFFRNHPLFFPAGTNVNFVQIPQTSQSSFLIRTYERGVERETLACGTGACAAAIAIHKRYQAPFPLMLQVRSQQTLQVTFTMKDNIIIDSLKLKGAAEWVRDGILHIDHQKCALHMFSPGYTHAHSSSL